MGAYIIVREHVSASSNEEIGQEMRVMKPVLAAFIEATEVAQDTALLETDRLAALRTFFAHKAVLGLVICISGIAGKVSSFQYPGDGIGDGQHQPAILKDRMLTADTFELIHDVIYFYTGSQRQGRQAADGFGFGGGGLAGFADGGKDFKRFLIIFSDGHIKMAVTGFYLSGEAIKGFRSFFDGPQEFIPQLFFLRK